MDAKTARCLIDEVCSSVPTSRRDDRSFLERVVRPVGLGLLLGFGSVGFLACGDGNNLPPAGDAYGVSDIGHDIFVPGVDAYGLPGDVLPPYGDLYGVVDVISHDVMPPVGDAYGVPDISPADGPPPAVDMYGVPDF